jgi:hypothetical protein
MIYKGMSDPPWREVLPEKPLKFKNLPEGFVAE